MCTLVQSIGFVYTSNSLTLVIFSFGDTHTDNQTNTLNTCPSRAASSQLKIQEILSLIGTDIFQFGPGRAEKIGFKDFDFALKMLQGNPKIWNSFDTLTHHRVNQK